MAEIVRILAYAVLVLSAAGAVSSASALAIDAAGARLSAATRELCWRLVGGKLAGGRDHDRGGVLVGLLWLAVLALAGVGGYVSLRDRGRRATFARPWPERTAWATATASVVTIEVLVTGAAG